MKRFLDYNKKLKQRAAKMRKNMTPAERKLWFEFLKDFSKDKHRVYRQRIIDNFIVDFYIPDIKLVIEIDGESHFQDGREIYDGERTIILEGMGCKVLRYTNKEVYENFEGIVKDIGEKFPLIKGEKTIE